MYQNIKITNYLLILCVFQAKFIFANNLIGDACKLENNPGKCMLVKDCPSAIKEIIEGKYPKICAFQQKEPIICCPEVTGASVVPEKNTKPVSNSERISRQKCREYGQSVFELVDTPLLQDNFNSGKANISKCRIDKTGFIIPGPSARPGEFPHMALIGYEINEKTDWTCSGVLISDQYVLTTAACSLNSTFRGLPKKVRLGTTYIKPTENEQNMIEVNIKDVLRHPDFIRPKIYMDIALFKLEHPIKFNEYVRPACLPDLNQKPNKKNILSGWVPLIDPDDYKLLHYVVEIESNEQCTNSYKNNNNSKNRWMPHGFDNNTQLCTKIDEDDECGFLFGSPIQTYDSEIYCMYNVQGLFSVGNSCNFSYSPIYTKIASYLEWIEKIVWP